MTVKRPQPNGLDHGPGLVDKASALLSAFEEVPERTAAELAEVLDEPVSSTYRMIASLIDLDILAPSPERGRYRLGLATAIAGSHLEDRLSLHEAARPRLQRLTRLTNATALIMVRSGMEAVCVDRVAGNGAGMIAMGLGGRLPLWIGGAPMAILANLAPVDRDGVIDCLLRAVGGDLPTPPPSTIDHEIGLTLERGYSMTRGDTTFGIAAVGVPVFNHRGELAAGLAIAGARPALESQGNEAIRLIVEAAADLSADLGFMGHKEDAR